MAGPVRQPIDVKALEAYIERHVPEIETPLDVKQFGFGQSNPTYQLTSPSGARYVLRKKPPGKLLSGTAHKVEREHRIIAALGGGRTDVPVPRAYALCEDASVIGTPFYLMSFLDGRVITDPSMPDAASPAERTALWEDAVRTLARLHRVDVAAVGLASFGKKGGFYARQTATWRTICGAQAATRDVETGEPVGQLPHFDAMMAFFADAARQPRDRTTLIHGDYKIDNLVFHKTEPRVIGILDWEMSTTGHPLSDLLNCLTPFYTAHLPPGAVVNAQPAFLPGATPGLPSASHIVALYAREAGWTTSATSASSSSPSSSASPSPSEAREGQDAWPDMARELRYAAAFNIFRLAAICQGIAARYAARQASSAQARRYAAARGPLGEFAWRLVCEARERDQEEGEKKEAAKL